MTSNELKTVLEAHRLWLTSKGGKRADLSHADLSDADLHGADLRNADLHGADLHGADLRHADLCYADLCYADLHGANLDYAAWPLWCGSLGVKIDARIAAQLVYHVVRACQSVSDDAGVAAFCGAPEVVALANRFHRASECGKRKGESKE